MLNIRSSYEVAHELLEEARELRIKIGKAQHFVNSYDPDHDAKYCLVVDKIKEQISAMRKYHNLLIERLEDLMEDDIRLKGDE